MWKILWMVLFLYILTYTYPASPAFIPKPQTGIIYPQNDSYDDCYLDEEQHIKGKCKNLTDCPSALYDQRKPPKTCYFNKYEQIVCCQIGFGGLNSYIPIETKRRPSELECMLEPKFSLIPPLQTSSHQLNIDDLISVVHGKPTELNEFPYMAALGWSSNFDSSIVYRCGGALITKRFVLTAAHCTDFAGSSPKYVRIGGMNLTDTYGSSINIKRILVHPAYKYIIYHNDIALIELEEESNKNIVCLWTKYEVPNINVIAIGYGHTMFGGKGSDQLLKANLNIVSNNICRGYYTSDSDLEQQEILNTQICAGDPEHLRDTCQGDSGGPIIMKHNDHDYIVGITSFGQGCAGQPPSVYTRISAYIDWIEDIVLPTTIQYK